MMKEKVGGSGIASSVLFITGIGIGVGMLLWGRVGTLDDSKYSTKDGDALAGGGVISGFAQCIVVAG